MFLTVTTEYSFTENTFLCICPKLVTLLLTLPLSGERGYCVMTPSHCASDAATRTDVNTCTSLLPGYSFFFIQPSSSRSSITP